MSRVISLVVLLALIALFGVLFYLVVARFFVPLFLAALLTVLFRPLHRWIVDRSRGYERIGAGLTTAAILMVVLLPAVGVVVMAAGDAVELIRSSRGMHVNHESFDSLIFSANESLGLQLDPVQMRHDMAGHLNQWLGPIAAKTPGVLLDFVIGFFVLILALYYFLADGRKMMDTVMRLVPLERASQQRLVDEFEEVSRAIVSAHLLAGVAQAILAGIGFYFAGLGSVFLLMLLTFLGSMIPFVGAASVWVSASIWLVFIDGRELAGILLAVYGVTIISMVDNILKPLVLHGQSKLNPLLAVLSVLGGVQALGPIGIFVGPMAVAFLQVGLNMLHAELEAIRQREGIDAPANTPPTASSPQPAKKPV